MFVFVATLGYCGACTCGAFRNERQENWLRLESAFERFGGRPRRCCSKTTAICVVRHDLRRASPNSTRGCTLSPSIGDFAAAPCLPYRARTKGKDERGVAMQEQCDRRPVL